ncbi:alpha/beta hydrolase [Mycoplasmopsis phocirhinis]|uniref:Alpha/beta hydrolase n=1 Tax=Mycoplasmopsis phocirhinis TaxID=142650 RepID=A0A4P6MRU1_9BACT|nr:alpha/beta hydrolase [Mycoplasmopsis phocirhinis]QBF34364.1 alpha/beta hydrolase [Mycoplasmopsis phocirhinis]
MKQIIYDYPYVFKDNHNPNENIIFVHGFNSNPNAFKIFEKYWTKSNYYAIQFPGNSKVKAKKNHKLNVYQYAQLLVEFVEQNDLKNVTLIGHSMGGGTISLAYKLKPHLFKKMVYIAPMNKTSLATAETYKQTYFPKTFDEFLNFLQGLYFDISKFTNDEKWMRLTKATFNADDFNNSDVVELGNSLPVLKLHEDIELGLKSITVPTLLILGEKDAVIDRDNCLNYFNEHVKYVQTTFIPKTGHMMFEENWENFISILEPFLLN